MSKKHKEHLKHLLVARGLAESSDEAERLVVAGQVKVAGCVATHAGELVARDSELEVSGAQRYVSRGGSKLEGALRDFSFDPAGLLCLDAGASTGGFTDCLLQAGAAHVVSVDVGYGQFDWRLRTDERVTLFERTNIGKVEPEALGAPFELLVADLSFTSLARLASPLARLVSDDGQIISLVKPQFELPKSLVKSGVVRDPTLHVQALTMVEEAFGKNGVRVKAMSYSPLLGPKGNIEFWIWAVKDAATATIETKQNEQANAAGHEGKQASVTRDDSGDRACAVPATAPAIDKEEVVRIAHEQLLGTHI